MVSSVEAFYIKNSLERFWSNFSFAQFITCNWYSIIFNIMNYIFFENLGL